MDVGVEAGGTMGRDPYPCNPPESFPYSIPIKLDILLP